MSNQIEKPLPFTKIVATLGPASSNKKTLTEMIKFGVSVVRLNFSHGSHAEHLKRIELTRECAAACNRHVGILADLQGPKIRIASFKKGQAFLEVGATFTLDVNLNTEEGTAESVSIDYKNLPNDVQPGDTLVLDDGRIVLEIDNVAAGRIFTTVRVGGVLTDHKGINKLGGGLSAKALTAKDLDDMRFALEHGVDYIAISFPRSAADIQEAREHIKSMGGCAGIIAKIERTEAVTNLEEITEASDGTMVARGDLAVEIGDANVPVIQKKMIQLARQHNKPVITATQMMESMISNTIPTRAEVSDVANAVLDITDAVMLSAETAVGEHPALVIKTVARTCLAAEEMPDNHQALQSMDRMTNRVDQAIAMATMYTANHLDIAAIIALTESGMTPLWMSRIRSSIPIYGLSRNLNALGRMTLYRNVFPIQFDVTNYTHATINQAAVNTLQEHLKLPQDTLLILTKGDHLGVGGGANAMKILKTDEIL
ncbi:MAG: pyruvate kinase [Gammaproteobacteria bacterium RIFCSPHIGHO2_12_FULL_41_15]|nr:MAG: pyruvate kinase [Gammaproteobacteria bacterium RIFCSPHIGHO2_12_FULL_41_15]